LSAFGREKKKKTKKRSRGKVEEVFSLFFLSFFSRQ